MASREGNTYNRFYDPECEEKDEIPFFSCTLAQEVEVDSIQMSTASMKIHQIVLEVRPC